MLLKLYVKFRNLGYREEGQDLVEYTLVVALISLAAVASMKAMATTVSTEFSVVVSVFAASV
jgi:pilus assembly protein Flp/PilA